MHYYYKRDWFDGTYSAIWYKSGEELSEEDFKKYNLKKCSGIRYYLARETDFLWRIKCHLSDFVLWLRV